MTTRNAVILIIIGSLAIWGCPQQERPSTESTTAEGAGNVTATSTGVSAPPSLFTEVPASELQTFAPQAAAYEEFGESMGAGTTRAVRVAADLLKTQEAVTLNLFPETNVVATRSNLAERAQSDFTWMGDLAGDSGTALFTVQNGDVAGTVEMVSEKETTRYSVRALGDGLHAIAKIDEDEFPPEDDDAEDVTPNDNASESGEPTNQAQQAEPTAAAAAPVIRVLVGYTPAATRQVGNTTVHAQHAIDNMNLSFQRSGVTGRVERAGVIAVAYSESGKTYRQHVSNFRSNRDVQRERDATRADVALLVLSDAVLCGRAADILATADTAFAVAHYSCAVDNHTFSHEIGHLLGARHNEQSDSSSTGNRRYVHGYRILGVRRTIMSYACNGDNPQPCGSYTRRCPKVNRWSNPRQTMGNPARPLGTVATNDNVRLLNETVPIIARFRN
jgi:hypothetical protein